MNKSILLAATVIGMVACLAGCAQSPDKKPEVLHQAEQYQRRGVTAFKHGDYFTAETMFETALRIYEGVDGERGRVRAHINLAETNILTRNYDSARANLEQASNVAARDRLPNTRKRIALLRSTIALSNKQYSQALGFIEAELPPHQDAYPARTDTVLLAMVANRTRIAFALEPEHADLWVQRFEQAMGGKRSPSLEGRLFRFKAQLAAQAGQYDEAHTFYKAALQQYKTALAQPGIAATLLESGALYGKQQQWHPARENIRRGIKARIQITDRTGTAQAIASLANIESQSGRAKIAGALKETEQLLRGNGAVNWDQIRDQIDAQ